MLTGFGHVANSSVSSLNLSGIDGLFKGIIIFLVFLWIIAIIWTAKDIGSRTNSVILQVISILFVTLFTPFIGLPLYWVIRPVYYSKDKIPRREACASDLIICYNCHTLNPKEYNCCINCGEHLKIKCKQCENLYSHQFSYCNKCGAPNLEK